LRVIIVGRNTACSSITSWMLIYCDTLSRHNVPVTQYSLHQKFSANFFGENKFICKIQLGSSQYHSIITWEAFKKIDIFSEGCLIYSRYTNLIISRNISRNISNEILRIKFHILIHRRISSLILIGDQLRAYSINTWQHYCRAILHTRVHIENIIKFNLTFIKHHVIEQLKILK